METKYNWFALGVISSGIWCPVPLHCDRAFSLCEEYHLCTIRQWMLYNFSSGRLQSANMNYNKYILYV